ncbi:synaptotagmin-15-like [Limulus polyphemus]|uniref:Synaptotagmin-15-like n=1 Tax=Limulus polyphemus TaxID=6850 RepID=A0ABM1SSE3_LIMPO|nr:synaptotagmin-15-like [Limulus polyphemus]
MQPTATKPKTLPRTPESQLHLTMKRRQEEPAKPQVQTDPITEQEPLDGDVPSLRHPLLLTLGAVGFASVIAIIIGFAIYRRWKRQRSYEELGKDSAVERYSRKSADASIYGCITQERPIDFVVPTMSLPVQHSPGEASLSSGSSPDAILWSRLSLIDSGTSDPSESSLFGGLNPELYKVCHNDTGEEFIFPDDHRGRLWFSLEYDAVKERLVLQLIKGKNFPSRTLGSVNCCDPFVRIFLLPDERRYLQTKVAKKTCNPKFEEQFIFQVSPDLGELLVSLTYSQNLERLTITIFEAQGLQIPEDSSMAGSYVKLTLMIDNKPVKTKKSSVARKTAEPKNNETFIFRLGSNCVSTASLILQVIVANGNQKDKCLGRIVLGSYMFARGKALEHWNEIVAGNHHQVRYWHKLT